MTGRDNQVQTTLADFFTDCSRWSFVHVYELLIENRTISHFNQQLWFFFSWFFFASLTWMIWNHSKDTASMFHCHHCSNSTISSISKFNFAWNCAYIRFIHKWLFRQTGSCHQFSCWDLFWGNGWGQMTAKFSIGCQPWCSSISF